jgi:hypothetical protein
MKRPIRPSPVTVISTIFSLAGVAALFAAAMLDKLPRG